MANAKYRPLVILNTFKPFNCRIYLFSKYMKYFKLTSSSRCISNEHKNVVYSGETQ